MAKRKRMKQEDKDDLKQWHEHRLKELNYCDEIVIELSRSMDKWLRAA